MSTAVHTRQALTYAVEPWERYWPDVQPLWVAHWKEVALDHSAIPLAPDMAKYQAYADAGVLHIVTMRTIPAEQLVGYWTGLVCGHLHYASTLFAFTDLYYVVPAYRRGWAGIRLFREVERSLRARGVRKIQTATKLHNGLDMSRLLERLGYACVEKLYTKLVED